MVEYHEDHLTFTTILRAVPPEILPHLSTKCTAQSTWEVIKLLRIRVQSVREVNVDPIQGW
jgi:hypothetical protein